MATTNGTNGHVAGPKIIFYTNHRCPYAHRAQITLDELQLPYEEVIIDLETPRPQWYLDINPRGLVPSIKYSVPGLYDEPEILTESAIVAQFLADSFPSPLLPATRADPTAPLVRARINFFVDTYNTKVSTLWFQVITAGAEDKQAKVDAWVSTIEKELEPLLKDAGPFFGGSKELTFAEVIVAPFLLRWHALSQDGELIPKSLNERLDALPNFGRWAKATRENANVGKVWDPVDAVQATKRRVEKMKAASAAK